jgi:hypothetical protein
MESLGWCDIKIKNIMYIIFSVHLPAMIICNIIMILWINVVLKLKILK